MACNNFNITRPTKLAYDLSKRRLELMGLGHQINGPTTVEELKDLVNDRWRKPHKACDEVYSKIFVGGEKAARDVQLLKDLGITHTINAACTDIIIKDIYYLQNGVRILSTGIDLLDKGSHNVKSHFEEANRFIEVALLTGGKVLIYCKYGICSSAAIAIAYLMMRKNMSALEAVKTVRGKRTVQPDHILLNQLVELDEQLRKDRAVLAFAN